MADINNLTDKDYYMGNPTLKGPGVAMNFTPEQVLEIQKCSDDPVYFMENYVSITTLDNGVVKFKMYDFQKDIVNTIHNNRFVLCKIARQSGKCSDINTPIRLRNKKTGEILDTTIGAFYNVLHEKQSNNSNGLKFIQEIPTDEWEVDTPTGYQSFSGIGKTKEYTKWIIKTANRELVCADYHIVIRKDINDPTCLIEVYTCDLQVGNMIFCEGDTFEEVLSVEQTNESASMYDLIDVANGNIYYTNGIASHNSTTTMSYVLHQILFNPAVSIGVLANKQSTAKGLLSMLKTAYENLPKWMQQGVTEWNKHSIQLENGSKVVVASTSSSAARGGSFNCISGDSIITLRDTTTNNIFTCTIEEFTAKMNSSRNTEKHKYIQYEDNRQQIQEVVLFNNSKKTFLTDCGINSSIGEASYYSPISRRGQYSDEYNYSNSTRTSSSTQTINKIYNRSGQIQNDFCISSDAYWQTGFVSEYVPYQYRTSQKIILGSQKIFPNRKKAFFCNKNENRQSSYRKTSLGANEKITFYTNEGTLYRKNNAEGTRIENFSGSDWEKEINRTCEQNKQKSRKNSQNSQSSYWDETIGRVSVKNEFICQGKSKEDRTSESEANNGRNQRKNEAICTEESSSRWPSLSKEGYEILTPNGYKSFKGIKKSYNQTTIKISTKHKSIICTPNHKIYSNKFVEASSLSVGDLISTIDGEESIESIEINKNTDVYDILHVEDIHSFYANGIHVSNCIILDEFAFVQPNLAEDFFSSVFPTISAGTNSKLIVISTPNGLNLFYKLWMESVTGKNSYKRVEAKWNAVPGRDETFKQTMLTNFAGNKEARWSAEFEVEFLGSDDTLLSPSALGSLVFMEPIKWTPDGLKIYEPPNPDSKYILCVDPSQGLNQDYHGITIVDCTKTPYKVVAVFRNNELSPQLLPNIVNKLARQYNMAYVLIEINDPVGLSVAEHLESEFEYEYLVHVLNLNHKKGQRAELGYGSSKMAKGVKMSYQIKNFGCSRLKDFIENQKLIVNDFDLISELSTFVKVRNTYGASEGNHDDLVMSLVCFCWLTSQQFFKEYINTDLKRRIFEDKIRKLEEDVSLFGFIETGLDDTLEADERDFDSWLADEGGRKKTKPNEDTDINKQTPEFDW